MQKTFFIFIVASSLAAALSACAGDLPAFHLPYAAGASFVVTQGYDSPPTHVKKDEYAVDFTQDGCDAYGKTVAATSAGTVLLAEPTGYNGGYGTQILVDHDGNIVSRYAHMISDSLTVKTGDAVPSGAPLGAVGDTGLVAGNACHDHPGTHVHFAVYRKLSDGTYAAVKPEPLSGYRNIAEGKWYEMDGAVAKNISPQMIAVAVVPVEKLPSSVIAPHGDAVSGSMVLGVAMTPADFLGTSSMPASVANNSITQGSSSLFGAPRPTGGGVSVSGGGGTSYTPAGNGNNTSVLTENTPHDSGDDAMSTSPDHASSSDNNATSTSQNSSSSDPTLTQTSTPPTDISSTTPSSSPIVALDPPLAPSGTASFGSFDAGASTVSLSWQAPDNASGTIFYSIFNDGGTMPLWQGTSTSATLPVSDAAAPTFIIWAVDGGNRVATTTVHIGAPPNQISGFHVAFDANAVALGLSWDATTDPDTTSSLVTYEYAVSTSTSLANVVWQFVGRDLAAQMPVVYPNIYLAAVRATDNLGNISIPTGLTWTFPEGYSPFPQQRDHSTLTPDHSTVIFLTRAITLSGVELWSRAGGGPYAGSWSDIGVATDQNGVSGVGLGFSPLVQTASSGMDQAQYYPVNPAPVRLQSGLYILTVTDNPGGGTNPTYFYGAPDGTLYYRLDASF